MNINKEIYIVFYTIQSIEKWDIVKNVGILEGSKELIDEKEDLLIEEGASNSHEIVCPLSYLNLY